MTERIVSQRALWPVELTFSNVIVTASTPSRPGGIAMIRDFTPPPQRRRLFDDLFVTKATRRVQAPAESHEYKKAQGSADGAHTYDTTAV